MKAEPFLATGKKCEIEKEKSRLATVFIAVFAVLCPSALPATQPFVAIHDSELTRALETMPASITTPHGAGTSGFEWFPTEWHYFVMPESVKEALRSDGTPFTVVGDSDIGNGTLLDNNGAPKFPIVISLAAEAIADNEIQPLLDYVNAGGTLFVGSSAFTRNPDGTTRKDFAIASALGAHMVSQSLLNWIACDTFSKQVDHRLVAHIPQGVLVWQLPWSSDEISWGISPSHNYSGPHAVWNVRVADAQVLAQANFSPYLLVKNYGKGRFIYLAAVQPLVGHGGWAPGMYSYVIFREAIQWAFESQGLPVPRLSPWPFPYDAAFNVRHDFENDPALINGIESSAQAEAALGVKGDYYFCTGALRVDMGSSQATIDSLRRAVANDNATIGSHNGGLPNPNNPALTNADYDYWHWGPDEALDVTPSGYTSGKAYAMNSLSASYQDVEGWLAGLNNANGLRVGTAPYFNATREDSYDIMQQLGVATAGEQKLSPFPHWTLSTQTSGKRYSFLSLPVSDWYVGTTIAQAMEYHSSASMHAAVDFYYNLGGLINIYSHSVSNSGLENDYITYSSAKPSMWVANATDVYSWWGRRGGVQANPSMGTSGSQNVITLAISGATDPQTAVEAWIPQPIYSDLQVRRNGFLASSDQFRTVGQKVRVLTGTNINTVEIRYTGQTAAVSDSYQAIIGQTLTVPAPGVLANDIPGVAGNPMEATLVTPPSHGTFNLNPDGSFTYSPAADFSGTDSFAYQASDGVSSGTAAVTLTVLQPPPVITSTTSITAVQSQVFTYKIAAMNSPVTFNATPLPPGLSVNTTTGLINGTSTATGTTNVTISAANVGGTGSAILTIAVVSPYTAWQNRWFTPAEIANPAVSGATACPAGDGISNLMKYALNLNPKIKGVAGLPTLAVATTGSGNYLTLAYTKVIQDSDITYIPEASGDLKQWNPGAVLPLHITNNPDGLTQTIVVQDQTPMGSTTKRFMRLRVTKP